MVKADDFVIINNRAYDPVTGLPVDGVKADPPKKVSEETTRPAPKQRGMQKSAVYASPLQRSATLSRRHVRQPAPVAIKHSIALEKRPTVRTRVAPIEVKRTTSHIQKAPAVKKFAPAQAPAPVARPRADRIAEKHPVAHRATSRQLDVNAPRRQRSITRQKLDTQQKIVSQPAKQVEIKTLKSAEILKNEAILEAMNREVTPHKSRRQKHGKKQGRFARFMTIGTSSLAIVLLAGYFTYLSMPQLSVRMAAVQSGVNAKYPGYSPSGYSLSGPIAFKDGEVTMKFAYASGSQSYTINQIRSTWDSSAVKEFVNSQSSDATTTVTGGLTIYTYGSNAAWVNSGVFYTLRGDAPLSSDQIAKIATSM